MGYKMHSNIDAIDMKHISYYYPLNESEGTTIVERTQQGYGVNPVDIITTSDILTIPQWSLLPKLQICDGKYDNANDKCADKTGYKMDIQSDIVYGSITSLEKYSFATWTVAFWWY